MSRPGLTTPAPRRRGSLKRVLQSGLATLLGALLLAAGPGKETADVPPKVADLLKQSSLVFRGTVQKLHASTLTLVPATDRTAVVRVDEIRHGAETVGDFTGQDITVVLTKPGTVKPGQRVMFFTNVKVIGASVAVEEVGHLAGREGERDGGAAGRQVAAAARDQADRRLQERIAQTNLIVAGTVRATKPLAQAARRPPGSEHDPEWREATIRVRAVEKGHAPRGGTVVVLYPQSRDIRWFRAPKFDTIRGERVFLLHRPGPEVPRPGPERRAAGVETYYTALDPLDVQPPNQLERIRALARRPE